MKICPNCSKKIQDRMTVCPYCGTSLKPSWISRARTSSRYRFGVISAIVALGIVIFGGIYAAYKLGLFSPRLTCFDQSQVYLNQFMPLFSQWISTDQKTTQLDKRQLELSEIALEGIRQQIIDLKPPECAQEAQKLFTSFMDETLNGYNALMSGEPGNVVKSHMENASQYYTQYRTAVLELYPELSISPTP